MYDISIILPAYNERENIKPVFDILTDILHEVSWEMIVVDDDSPDGTAEVVNNLAHQYSHVKCLHRVGKRGLSSACIDGILMSKAPYVAVMDADLQHDPAILPKMLNLLRDEDLDIIVGSRYVAGGGVDDWSQQRQFVSRFATRLAHWVLKQDLKDPMSGYFVLDRKFFNRVEKRLNGKGFKILLDLFLSSKEKVKFKEYPYSFRKRNAGESKLGMKVIWEFLILLFDKAVQRR